MWVAGRVVDSEGAAVAGARLRLRPPGSAVRWEVDAPGELETASGGDGGFRFPALAAEDGRRLRVDHVGFAPLEVQAPPGTSDVLELVLAAGGAVIGRVIDGQGEPLPGTRVRLFRVPETDGRIDQILSSPLEIAEAVAGERGAFAFDRLAGGRYELAAAHPEHVTQTVTVPELSPGTVVNLGSIELAPGAPLTGMVVDSQGRPLAGAELQAYPTSGEMLRRWDILRGQSGDDGRFELTGMPLDASLELDTGHPDHLSDIRYVTLPLERPLRIELARAGRVFGRVSLLQGAGATSQAVGIDGRFLFRRVAPGTYHLTASAPGLVLAGPPPEVEVTESPLPAIDLVLVGGGEIYGELRGLTADQPSEVWIAAYCEQCGSDSARRMVPAEPGGRYRLAGLEPGRWMVVAVDPATGRSARGEVEVEEGGGAYRLDLDF
jgi:protocatechuate 3,4-dioxygenase beta subunit